MEIENLLTNLTRLGGLLKVIKFVSIIAAAFAIIWLLSRV